MHEPWAELPSEKPLQKRFVVRDSCKFGWEDGVHLALHLHWSIRENGRDRFDRSSRAFHARSIRSRLFSVEMWRKFPDRSAVNLQPLRARNGFWSHPLRQEIISAHSSRQMLTLGPKTCYVFTLFTTSRSDSHAPERTVAGSPRPPRAS